MQNGNKLVIKFDCVKKIGIYKRERKRKKKLAQQVRNEWNNNTGLPCVARTSTCSLFPVSRIIKQ